MHPIATGLGQLNQVHVDEVFQDALGFSAELAEQRRRRGQADVRPGREAEQAEGPCSRAVRKSRVADLEARADVLVAEAERVQPAPGDRQPVCHVLDPPTGPGDQTPADQPDRQRQVCARGQHGPGRLGLGRHPAGADDPAQELMRGLPGQRLEMHMGGSGQVGQPVADGHQHGTARRPRDQRPDLRGVPRVVQDDQNPPLREQAAVQAAAFLLAVGQRRLINARADAGTWRVPRRAAALGPCRAGWRRAGHRESGR